MITTRRFGFAGLLAALLTTFSSEVLLAQRGMLGGMGGDGISERAVKIAFGGGLTVTGGGTIKDRNENGFHFTGSVIRKLPFEGFSVRPEFTYTTFRFRSSVIPLGGIGEKNYTRILGLTANLERALGESGVYLLAGGGAGLFSNHLARGDDSARGTGVMLNAGGGYRFEFGPLEAFFEVRLATTSIDEKKFGYDRAKLFPFTFGFVF